LAEQKGANAMSPSNESNNKTAMRPRTALVRGGLHRSPLGETSEAIFLTSGFVYDDPEVAAERFSGDADGYTYSRLRNPTVAMFEERMALIGGTEIARATASGMAAVAASFLSQVKVGDHVVSGEALFGSIRVILEDVLPRFGVDVTMVDNTDLEAWKQAVQPETTLFFLESPSNPTLGITDLQAVADIAHNAGAKIILDNVFATPVLQRPVEFDIDITIYSATKHIDGQGRCLGGCILSDQKFLDDFLDPYLRHTGPALSPFNAWVLLKGIETLELRVEAACRNAQHVADFLAEQPGVTKVLYPGRQDHPQHTLAMRQMSAGGTLVSFELPGGRERAFAFLKALDLIDISNNLGDTKSLITHPASTTHQRLSPEDRAAQGIGEGLVRLSVGLEDADDLTDDIGQALAMAAL
jgi:O-succinylhomoserine sulfhydrylase